MQLVKFAKFGSHLIALDIGKNEVEKITFK
jgi:hypothetical protein